MFNSCFHLEPASQDGDILEVNLCRPHYLKYKNPPSLNYEVSCRICDKCSHHLHNYIYFSHIHRKLCVLDHSSFELNEHNEMTLNKVPYNEPCYLQGKQMCEKLTDHKTTVYVGMFNSCFHLEPASQDGDILEVNLCRPHYLKYKNYETLQSNSVLVSVVLHDAPYSTLSTLIFLAGPIASSFIKL
jgi:hypothetical protein